MGFAGKVPLDLLGKILFLPLVVPESFAKTVILGRLCHVILDEVKNLKSLGEITPIKSTTLDSSPRRLGQNDMSEGGWL